MRVLSGLLAALAALGAVSGGQPADKNAKAKAAKSAAPAAPKSGVRTPGIQIPFASLRPEATIDAPSKPGWIFFSAGSVFAPGQENLLRIDAKTNKPGDPVAGLKRPCGGMVSAFGSLWAPDCGTGSLLRIDPKTYKVTAIVGSGAADVAGSIASSPDSVWLLTDSKTTLSRIDPDQNAVVGEFRLPSDCRSLTFGETSLWLACPSENKVLRVNPATNLVDKTIDVSGKPESIALGESSVWVLCLKDGKIDRIDPKTNKVTKTIETNVPGVDGSLVFGEGALWVTMTGFPLTRIDPQSETVAQQFYGGAGGGIQTSVGALWLSNRAEGKLLRIDPKRVLATLAE
jgi:streptogramin lyase